MAASKDRMVSNGRSNRGRHGFERSGSAVKMISNWTHDNKQNKNTLIRFPYWSLCCMALSEARFDFSSATATVLCQVAETGTEKRG